MILLGIRINAHDSNLCLYDGKLLRYLKTERKYQIKHHESLGEFQWRQDVMDAWGLDYRDIDEVCISLEENTYIKYIDDPFDHNGQLTQQCVGFPLSCPVYSIDHHYAHSLSYVPHIKPDVSIIVDGIGDNEVPWSVFKGDKVIETGNVFDHGSIGLLMNEFGKFVGVKYGVEVDIAGKVMGFQSYGNFDKAFYDKLDGLTMYDIKDLFNINKWHEHKGDDLVGKYTCLDWIKTIHVKAGNILLKFFQVNCKPDDVIFYSGGVAQNVIWNTQLKEHFPNLVILPHSADDGISIGAVEWLRIKNNQPRVEFNNFPFAQSDQAPEDVDILNELIDNVANLLADGKIVAWYQGNGEIGPRALGNRSILMNPEVANGKDIINRVKRREQYRPFGASILSEYTEQFFELPFDNPYMLYVGKARTDRFPAITHVDGTCRVQTVEKESGPFRKLLERFHQLTECPVLLNTSLNLGGKPVAGYIHNAQQLFFETDIDYLVVGNKLFSKN